MSRRSAGPHRPRPRPRRRSVTPSPTIARRRRHPPRLLPPLAPTPAPLAGTVVEVVDGDTVRVELPSGVETVRIIGIDTPEVVHPTEPEACFGAEATAFAKETLDGQAVTLELDPTQDERDRFDRLLAHVHVGDTLYAAEAIAAGYGIHYVYERPSIHAAELDAAESDGARGRARHLGLVRGPGRPAAVGRRRARRPSTTPTPRRRPAATATPPTTRASRTPATTSTARTSASRSTIIGPDEYRLDGSDHDGRGCESY